MTTFSATYSPEDNKLRLYASTRLDTETYSRVRDAGFRWAPRQELFVAPAWNPTREDLLIELAGEIEAEEMTLAERAAIKAERLDNLAAKKHAQANAFARRADELSEAFHMGQPILVGHHSERKARKTQERMNSAQSQAIKAEKAAGYWLYRATGVERFANMKNDPRTRANRIKTLLAELRDIQRAINTAHGALAIWERMTSDDQIRFALGNMDTRSTCSNMNIYFAVDKGEMAPADARLKCIERAEATINSDYRRRWIEHTLNRLSYERSMLGDVPRYEGELTPVILQAFAREHGAEKPKVTPTDPGSFQLESPVPLPLHLATGNYLDLTGDDWRDLMQETGYTVPEKKERRKSSKPAPAPLVNLSEAEAEQLQRIWNLQMVASCTAYQTPKENAVKRISQAVYAANSKGDYAHLKTVEIDAEGRRVRGQWRNYEFVKSAEPVARVRVYTGGGDFYKPDSVVFITDKPSKPLGLDLDAIERDAAAAAAVRTAEKAAAA